MNAHPPLAAPGEDAPQSRSLGPQKPWEERNDIERLVNLPKTWAGLDPTAIAESVMQTLLDMLDLDFVAIQFSDATPIFLHFSGPPRSAPYRADVSEAIERWLLSEALDREANLSFAGHSFAITCSPLGHFANVGVLVSGARRSNFPLSEETLRLDLAASQTGLACREVRELSDRSTPVDTRTEKPTGDALAENEWRLNLIINTMPAMAWSSTPDGMIDFGNQHFLDFIGGPFEEIAGLNFYRIFHPDDTPKLLAAWQEIMATKRSQDIDGRLRRADGEFRWCTLRQKPLLNESGEVIKWYGLVFDIEDRKRAENALRETESALLASEQNLNLIINSLPVLAWSARPDGTADFINQSWLDYAGVSEDQILEWGFQDLYHPDDIDGMMDIWIRDLETAGATFLKGRIRRWDGEYRWFYFSGRKFTDANGVERWFGVNVDIEDLQRAEDALKASEAALRESERRLQHIIDTIPGLVWSSDAHGSVTFLSQSFLDYIGLGPEEASDGGWAAALHPEDAQAHLKTWSAVMASGRQGECEARLRGRDGRYRWFLFRANPFYDEAGDLTQWSGVNIDIEERKRALENLRQSQTDLAHVTRMTTMDELAVSIAHEINQPLMAVVTNAGTCLRWLEEAQLDLVLARQAAERIVRDGHRAGDIIASIRALARKAPPDMVPILLNQVVQEVLDLLGGELRRRGVRVETEFSSEPLRIIGDSTQLQQVVLNVVLNGVDAMEAKDKEDRRLSIRTLAADLHAVVEVADSGVGLRSGQEGKIFEAFFSTKSKGIGMGLAICRSIIEAHGGKIWANANRPSGSIFSFSVPLQQRVDVIV